jgi:hypothetical protein
MLGAFEQAGAVGPSPCGQTDWAYSVAWHALRDGSPVAAAEEAAGSIGQPVPLWFMHFKRRFMERLERNHAPLLFLDGPFSFALICVYCQLFISP